MANLGLRRDTAMVYGQAFPSAGAHDYDMVGYTIANGLPDQRNGQHLTDTYKLPNHPTFSQDSMYSAPGQQGGQWKQLAPYKDMPQDRWDAAPGRYEFMPSPANSQFRTPNQLADYIQRYETRGTYLKTPLGYVQGSR